MAKAVVRSCDGCQQVARPNLANHRHLPDGWVLVTNTQGTRLEACNPDCARIVAEPGPQDARG